MTKYHAIFITPANVKNWLVQGDKMSYAGQVDFNAQIGDQIVFLTYTAATLDVDHPGSSIRVRTMVGEVTNVEMTPVSEMRILLKPVHLEARDEQQMQLVTEPILKELKDEYAVYLANYNRIKKEHFNTIKILGILAVVLYFIAGLSTSIRLVLLFTLLGTIDGIIVGYFMLHWLYKRRQIWQRFVLLKLLDFKPSRI